MIQNAASSCEDLLDDGVIKKFEKIYLSLVGCSDCFKLVQDAFPYLDIGG
jgi:hypothetical protein